MKKNTRGGLLVGLVLVVGVFSGCGGDKSDEERASEKRLEQWYQVQEKRYEAEQRAQAVKYAGDAVYTICASPSSSKWDCEHIKDLKVNMVEMTQGDIAALALKACYAAGYPVNPHPEQNGLSRRRVAECDRILKELAEHEARSKAEEAKKDAEYDKAHPVK